MSEVLSLSTTVPTTIQGCPAGAISFELSALPPVTYARKQYLGLCRVFPPTDVATLTKEFSNDLTTNYSYSQRWIC